MTIERMPYPLMGDVILGNSYRRRLLLRPHGRSEGRVLRFRRPGGWDIRSATGYPSVAYDTRAQAAQAVWEGGRNG